MKNNRVQIKITVDENILREIDKMAKQDNRNRSNFIETLLKNIVEIEKSL